MVFPSRSRTAHPHRSALLPLVGLAVLVGVLVGVMLVTFGLAPRRERVVYERRPTPELVTKGGLDRLLPEQRTGDPLLDCVARFLRTHGADEVTRTQGMTSPAFQQLSLQAQFACTSAPTPAAP